VAARARRTAEWAKLAALAKKLPATVAVMRRVEAQRVVVLAAWFEQNRTTERGPNLPAVI